MSLRRGVRLLALLIVALVTLASRTARASTTELVVLSDGAGSAAVAGALRTSLAGEQVSLGDGDGLKATMGRTWSTGGLLGALTSGRRERALEDVRRAAQASNVDAVLLIEVRATKRERTARVALIDVHDAAVPFEGDAKLPARSSPTADAARIRAALEPHLGKIARSSVAPKPADASPTERAEAPVTAPAAPATTGREKDAPASEAPAAPDRDLAHAGFVVEPRVGLGTRHFAYSDRITPGQRPYNLAAAPIIGVGAEVYPLAFVDPGVPSWFGIVGAYSRAVALQSATPSSSDQLGAGGGQTVDTSWSSLDMALRARFPLTTAATLGIKGGYGVLDYSFKNAGALADGLPTVTYRFARAGVDARVHVWRIAILGGLDYLAVFDGGTVASRYPHAKIGGIDAALGLGLTFAGHFEARTGVRYQRFFYSMNPVPGDAYVAGGALDELARWDTSLAFHY
jgi:hypothetical protein